MAQLLFLGTLTIYLGLANFKKRYTADNDSTQLARRSGYSHAAPLGLRIMYSRAAFGPNATQEC